MGSNPEVAALLTLAERLGDERALRDRLEADICATSGLHPASLSRLVDLWLGGLTAKALTRIAEARGAAEPLGTVAIVAPSNLCVATWQAMVEALLSGNQLIVRPGRGDPKSADNLRAVLGRVNAELAERVAVMRFERDDDAAWRAALSSADGLMIYGGDDAVAQVSALATEAGFAGPIRRHGHGLSLAFLPATVMADAPQLRQLAPLIAHDTLLADGRGCLSLRVLLIEGMLPMQRWSLLADVLAEAFAEAAHKWPQGQIATDLLARRRMLVEEAEFVAATSPQEALLRHDPQGGWAIVGWPQRQQLELKAVGPGARCLVMLSLPHRNELGRALAQMRPWLSTLAIPRTAIGVGHAALAAGFDRVCAPGQMQAPAADRPTNGYGPGQLLHRGGN